MVRQQAENLKIAENIDLCQRAWTAQADIVDIFGKCIKPPSHRAWLIPICITRDCMYVGRSNVFACFFFLSF